VGRLLRSESTSGSTRPPSGEHSNGPAWRCASRGTGDERTHASNSMRFQFGFHKEGQGILTPFKPGPATVTLHVRELGEEKCYTLPATVEEHPTWAPHL